MPPLQNKNLHPKLVLPSNEYRCRSVHLLRNCKYWRIRMGQPTCVLVLDVVAGGDVRGFLDCAVRMCVGVVARFAPTRRANTRQ